MDPNNLAVNSVINPYLTSSDDTSDCQREMKTETLTSFGLISLRYRLGVRDERLGCI